MEYKYVASQITKKLKQVIFGLFVYNLGGHQERKHRQNTL